MLRASHFRIRTGKISFGVFVLLLYSMNLFAQDDLLQQLQKEAKPLHEKVIATFKGSKIINMETNETLEKKSLDFRVNHQFGNIGEESGGGSHTLYGFDQSNDIRIALLYGVIDRVTVGVSRCKRNENLEALGKIRALEQTTDDKIPVSATAFGNITMTTKAEEFVPDFKHRLTWYGQLIVTRKFSPSLSLEITSAFLHRNLVPPGEENDLFSIGGGARWKFTKSASVIADYWHVLKRKNLAVEPVDPVGVGFEIETGGHVFTLMFTNASGILENDYLPDTFDEWKKGGIKFSFIISRIFKLGKEEKESAK